MLNLLTDGWLWGLRCQSHSETNLDFISTRLAHCLEKRPADVWSLVFCVEYQVLLLLTIWRRMFASYHFVTMLRAYVISCGACFIVSFCLVIEFRNDSSALSKEFLFPAMPESTLHNYAAVSTMLSFTLLHAFMCISLFVLQRHELRLRNSESSITADNAYVSAVDFHFRRKMDSLTSTDTVTVDTVPVLNWKHYGCAVYEYAALDWAYFACVLIFFGTWAASDTKGPLYDTAVHSEWVVLLLGVLMHVYALWQSERPLSWVLQKPANIFAHAWHSIHSCSRTWNELLMCASYVAAVLYTLLIFGMAPLTPSGDPTRAHTSTMTFMVVISTYLYTAILLLS